MWYRLCVSSCASRFLKTSPSFASCAFLRKLLWTFVQIEKVFRKVFRLLRRDVGGNRLVGTFIVTRRSLFSSFAGTQKSKVTANWIISFPYRLLIKYLWRLLLRLLIGKYFLVLIECYFRARGQWTVIISNFSPRSSAWFIFLVFVKKCLWNRHTITASLPGDGVKLS